MLRKGFRMNFKLLLLRSREESTEQSFRSQRGYSAILQLKEKIFSRSKLEISIYYENSVNS